MARRGENIYKRKDGRWEGRLPNGYYENGKKKYRSLYAKSYLELKIKMQECDLSESKSAKDKDLLMADAFRIWLKERKFSWKQSTYACYAQLVDNQIIPIIGNVPLNNFNATSLSEFIHQKKKSKNMEVSDTYLKNMLVVIIQTLQYFKSEYQYDITIPSITKKSEEVIDKKLPSEHTLKKLDAYLMEHCDDSTCLGILLCRYTGLRIGEICALRWEDIDVKNGIIHVKRTLQRVRVYEEGEEHSRVLITIPKTKHSIREIPLPVPIRELLVQHAKVDKEFLIQGFKTPYAEPRTLQYRFQSVLKKCDIPSFNFHMLRHLFATKCIAIGFDINSLSEILGHSNIQTTLNLYVHSSSERKHSLMNQFEL